MLRVLIEKEFRLILSSPRFVGIFAVVSVLILLSFGIGVQEYRAFDWAQAAAASLQQEELAEATEWHSLSVQALRQPDPLSVFAAGVHNDIGRLSVVSAFSEAKLRRSIYSDDPILAVFRFLDLTFIVQVVLSLFAILLTYDVVSGEREQGTLQLSFASAVPRPLYILGKLTGTWLGLSVPLVVPLAAGLLGVVVAGIALDAGDWQRLAVLLFGSILYFSFFVALGVAVSALTRRASTSFLVLLVAWILIVLVIPRTGIMLAVDLVPVPSVSQIESQKAGYERRKWAEHHDTIMQRWQDRQAAIEAQPEAEREAYEDEKTWGWMEYDEKLRKDLQAEIVEHSRRLKEGLRNASSGQQRLGLALARLSPAATFQLVALEMAGTGLDLKRRYTEAIDGYRESFAGYVESKGGSNRIMVRRRGSSDGGDSPFAERSEPLDLRDMPRFQAPAVTAREAAAGTIMDLSLLVIATLGCFAVAFVAFGRYDVRQN